MDPFGWTPEQYTAAGTWAMFFVLFFTALFAVWQVRTAEKARRDQFRPYVVPNIEIEQQIMFMLSIENLGKTPARNVRVMFDKPPQSSRWDLANLPILKEPIPTMAPGQKFRHYWERSLDVFDKNNPYPHPLRYEVTVTYEDHYRHRYPPERYILDFGVYRGQATGLKGMTDLIKAVEELVAEHKKWTNGTRGLRVNARNAVKEGKRDDRPWHFRQMRKAYNEDGLKGAVMYWIDVWRRRYGLHSR